MYRKRNKDQLSFVEVFFLPFGGKLRADNRWVKLSQIIPCIMARLQETSETVIALQFLVMNLGDVLRDLFCQIFKVLFSCFGESEFGVAA